MPNSLIFAVILAVWAVYLIQHWIRRRDHVATARSVDRFSEAMRVLERRQSMPRADLSVPAPRSYSVSLMRPAHPDVVVKRAHHQQSAPAPARRRRIRIGMPSVTVRRALALVVGTVGLGAGITLTVLGQLPLWGALAGVGVLLLSLTYIRFSVGRQRRRAVSPVRAGGRPVRVTRTRSADRERATARRAAAAAEEMSDEAPEEMPARARKAASAGSASTRRSARAASRRGTAARTSRQARTARKTRTAGAARGTRPAATPAALAAVDRPAATATAGESARSVPRRAPELYDVESAEAAAAPPVVETVPSAAPPAELEPGTWAPVPVPPPTYTLKARAPRQQVAASERSAEAGGEAVARVPAGTPVEDLPFDGHALALDEEFEELPAVHRVG